MTSDELRSLWKKEESIARIKGWDFSHIQDRYREENSLPWDYETIIHEVKARFGCRILNRCPKT